MKLNRTLLACTLALAALNPALAQTTEGHPDWPGAGQLFAGTCYQPVDRSLEQVRRDVALMKQSGFKVVRMGDLSWDYFEPAEGKFEFKHFDAVMNEMQAAGIRVILDIPGLPAPMWLHQKYPGVDIVNQAGTRLAPAERYMDNIGDPDYRRLAVRMADTLTKRYAKHPALLAVGYDNEIGNGFMSYSEADRKRFVQWLKKRYGSVEALNKAWATQRWSRRVGNWDEVRLPYADGPGPAERYLDLRRFWSDLTIATLDDLEAVRRRNTPGKPVLSNYWDWSGRKGFDFLGSYRRHTTFGAMGFYAGDAVGGGWEATLIKGGMTTPTWFNEFAAGGGGSYGSRGWSRMWAHFVLLMGGQAALAWTFNSHLGGEEQALMGLIDHDDRPSWKLGEWARIAADYAKLEKRGFPRSVEPKVAIAYSFENTAAYSANGPSNTSRQYLKTPYLKQALGAFEPLLKDNVDVAVIKLSYEDLSRYRLIIVPGLYLLDEASTEALRRFVADGGTAIMTAQSAKVNDNNQWHATPLPGGLTDVFGLRTNEFYDAAGTFKIGDEEVKGTIEHFEVLEPSTAEVLSHFSDLDGRPPALTVNRFGKGRAYYLATPAQPQIMRPLLRQLYASVGIEPGPKTPDGVFARAVSGRVLYVNTNNAPVDIAIDGAMQGVLGGQHWDKTLSLEARGVELLEQRN
ncbi:beta-galactosidase [Roseateles saccharophilus]|uniref:beta-galactosidase n=1 Tax=Roseateles saccharophilus TaxID=304 RepID=A0A4R3VJI6_ROSSA|nr:beta-galactosidase [Roseateles saccharophilus]MDG0832536.1 beta-galactosidase [Roseateles saccharophilus]TCV03998.1 beta-galactosidase [Roseateles saccharophilus]